MENLNQVLNMFSGATMFWFLFKAFAVIFSVMYLLYAVVISKQTGTMNKTLESSNNKVLFFIASLQIFLGFILIILSIFLL